MAFWYNISTGQVEEDGQTDPKADLMGPYPTRAAAEQALQTAAEKTEKWDEEDREWNEGRSGDAPA